MKPRDLPYSIMKENTKRLMQFCAASALLAPALILSGLRAKKASREANVFRVLSLHHVPDAGSFERLVVHLMSKHGIISPDKAETMIVGAGHTPTRGKIPYLLTFDDGFRSHAGLVKEILGRYGIKAVFFICPGIVDTAVELQRSVVARSVFDPPLHESEVTEGMLPMRWAEVEELHKEGHAIGSHSLGHMRASGLDEETLSYELKESASVIEKRIGVVAKWYAFPWGDIASIDEASLRLAGQHYCFCCSTVPSVNVPDTARLILFRMGVDLRSPFVYQQMVLAGGLDFLARNEVRTLLKLARKARTEDRTMPRAQFR